MSDTLQQITEARESGATSLTLSKAGTIPPEISTLSALEELTFYCCAFTTLPPEIGRLSSLRSLKLENTNAETLPAEIGQLSALEELTLYNCELTTLPDTIGQLPRLKTLTIWHNDGLTLPAGLSGPLKELCIRSCKGLTFPASLRGLVSLHTLIITSSDLTVLPECIGDLTALRTLDLSSNPGLHTLPATLAGLTTLTRLTLDHGRQVPGGLASLSALESLSLKSMALTGLALTASALPRLQHLDLTGNQLTAAPAFLAGHPALFHLNLRRNAIARLPDSLGTQPALRHLNLSSNPLEQLPESLARLPLKTLTLSDTPLLRGRAHPSGTDEIQAFILAPPSPSGAPSRYRPRRGQLSASIDTQLRRLGGYIRSRTPPTSPVTTQAGGEPRALPEPYRQLLQDVVWPTSELTARFGDWEHPLLTLFFSPDQLDEYRTEGDPVLLTFAADHHTFFAIDLRDRHPEDPTVISLDHAASRLSEHLVHRGTRLSDFLQGCQPEGSAQLLDMDEQPCVPLPDPTPGWQQPITPAQLPPITSHHHRLFPTPTLQRSIGGMPLAFSADNRQLLVEAPGERLRMLSTADLSTQQEWTAPKGCTITDGALSPRGDRIAVAAHDGSHYPTHIFCWQTDSPQMHHLHLPDEHTIEDIAFHPHRPILVVLCEQALGVFCAETLALVSWRSLPGCYYYLQVTAADEVRIWNSDHLRVPLTGSGPLAPVDSHGYSDSPLDVSEHAGECISQTGLSCDISTSTIDPDHDRDVEAFVFTHVSGAPCGFFLAEPPHPYTPRRSVDGVAISPDGRWLAGSFTDSEICIWDVTAMFPAG